MKKRYILAFYEIDREYGGPEEGGWWYDTGDLVRVVRVFTSEDKAYKAARRANELLRLRNKHFRDVGSTLYDGGAVHAEVYEGHAPEHYPEARPYYE